MKKLTILLICLCALLTSCGFGGGAVYSELNFGDYVFKTDDYVCCRVLDNIMKAIENGDKELLLSLFSENTRAECPDLEERAEELFDYCSGKMLSFGEFSGYPHSSEHFHGDGNYEKELEPTYDVNTDKGSYRIFFNFVESDTVDRANEGLVSLYIIRAEDDIDTSYAYRGDGKSTPGIHIGLTDESFDYE
jgi:hypothetical protein